MKKPITIFTFLFFVINLLAQSADVFKPYKATNLRLPSVPLIVSDPYFSIWSPYDQLNEGTTRHWTNDEKPLQGLLRVDGKTYNFLGSEREQLTAIAPMADEEAWMARYTMQKQDEGWQRAGFDDSRWQEGRAAFGSPGLNYIATDWRDEHSDL